MLIRFHHLTALGPVAITRSLSRGRNNIAGSIWQCQRRWCIPGFQSFEERLDVLNGELRELVLRDEPAEQLDGVLINLSRDTVEGPFPAPQVGFTWDSHGPAVLACPVVCSGQRCAAFCGGRCTASLHQCQVQVTYRSQHTATPDQISSTRNVSADDATRKLGRVNANIPWSCVLCRRCSSVGLACAVVRLRSPAHCTGSGRRRNRGSSLPGNQSIVVTNGQRLGNKTCCRFGGQEVGHALETTSRGSNYLYLSNPALNLQVWGRSHSTLRSFPVVRRRCLASALRRRQARPGHAVASCRSPPPAGYRFRWTRSV